MKKYSIEINIGELSITEIDSTVPEKIFYAENYYFEVGEYESIKKAQEKAEEIKKSMSG